MAVLGMGLGEINKLLQSVGEKVAPTSSSAYDMLRKREADLSRGFLSTGISDLDVLMNGGLPVGMITEIAGCPGSGKSQFCLGCLAEMVYLSFIITTLLRVTYIIAFITHLQVLSTSAHVVVFDTELKFNVARLREMLLARSHSIDIESVLARIILKRPLTCRALFEEIEGLESLVISKGVKLVIIDSIAALVRKEGLHEADKETYLVRQASTLKLIAELCGCTILVTNQVASAALLTTDSEAVNPSLGPIWNHCVSIRLTIQKSDDANQLDSSQSQSQLEAGSIVLETERTIRVAKAPSLSSFSLRCQIKKVGIRAILL